MGHALTQSLKGWTKRPPPLKSDDGLRRESAQLDWVTWREAHLTEIQNRLCYVATWAINSEEDRWGRSVVVKLENEINWVTYALRD